MNQLDYDRAADEDVGLVVVDTIWEAGAWYCHVTERGRPNDIFDALAVLDDGKIGFSFVSFDDRPVCLPNPFLERLLSIRAWNGPNSETSPPTDGDSDICSSL